MKITNKIISLMLSVQVAATSVFAVPDSLQKRPNPASGVTEPLDSKDKKNIDAKTMVKKTVLFSLKALWWATKPQLIMLGTGIFDLSLLAGYGGYKAYKWYDKYSAFVDFAKSFDFSGDQPGCIPLPEEKAKTLCADMYYCLKNMDAKKALMPSEPSSEYNNIAEKYSSLTDKFEIMEEFLSHFESIDKYLNEITGNLADLLDIPVYVYNEKYCIFAFDKSFKIDDQTIDQIIKKFYRQSSLLVDPAKNLDNQERATGVQQKLNAWKKTMYAISEI